MINLKKNRYRLNFLPIEQYLKIVRKPVSNKDLKILDLNNVKLITFKGPNSKKYIHESYINLLNYNEKN